ncbi:MAG: hypothetical protein UY75_C0010G0001, partial [Parcubacteria group bacterium GW2011_GWC2_52_8c]
DAGAKKGALVSEGAPKDVFYVALFPQSLAFGQCHGYNRYAVSVFLPFRRLLRTTARPDALRRRARNPWVFLRFLFFG